MKAMKSKILIILTSLVMGTQAGLIYASSFVN